MKTKTNGKLNNTKKEAEVSKFEAIKDILFGENIQNYDQEFESVKKDILNKRQELLDLIADTKTELDTAIDNLSTDLNIRITELDDKLQNSMELLEDNKVSKKVLGDLFIKLGNKLND
ncbi:fructose 1,6-bisphosphatase [Winogradskyella sp.]|uniref:fructose 1,6-bisphosphatase n=1 Tax=Winogradskyella sp. TaxID=1883156 RepID=UPI0025EC8686|nr:fructose 1,6-bisphosphatase [Winogradskyella sp.]